MHYERYAQACAEDNKVPEPKEGIHPSRVTIHGSDAKEEENVVGVQSEDGEDGNGVDQRLAVSHRRNCGVFSVIEEGCGGRVNVMSIP